MAQREIKFRAWDGKQMLTMDTERYSYPVFVCKDGYTWLNWDSLIKMQYTGLKDRNGVEIYENDIVHGYDGLRFEVQWVEYEASWNIGGHDAQNMDVIGNIHENPELLQP